MTNTELIKARVKEGKPGDPEGFHMDPWLDGLSIAEPEQVFQAMQRFAQTKGWKLSLVQRLPWTEGGKPEDIPEGAMASTQKWEKAIWVRTKATPSQRVYLAAHELGHALGDQSDGKLDEFSINMIRLGILERYEVPKLQQGEAEAELAASLVLMGLGATPNFDYFWNWRVSPELIDHVKAGAERVARQVLKAVEAQKRGVAA